MDLILEDYQSSDDDVEIVEVIEPVPEIPVPEPIVIEDVNMTRTSILHRKFEKTVTRTWTWTRTF